MEYKLLTTVDITATGMYRTILGHEKARNQQQNFDTVLQTIGIRGNCNFEVKPKVIDAKGSEHGFSTDKDIKIWQFEWRVETPDVFLEGTDPIALLKKDFELVPFITGLDETVVFKTPVWRVLGPEANIIFSYK